MTITKLDLTANRAILKLLVYGKPGSGKTTFTASASQDQRTSPVLHINLSGNPQSLTRYPKLPDVLNITELADLNPLYHWLKAGQPNRGKLVQEWGLVPGYRTLVIDGVTGLQRKVFDLAGNVTQLDPGTMPPKAEWDVYRAVLGHMLKIGEAFYQTLPELHVIMTALEHGDQRGEKPNLYRMAEPALAGASVEELPGEALAVIRLTHHTEVPPEVLGKLPKQPKYNVAQLQPTKLAYAKDQHLFKADYLPDLTVTMLLDRLSNNPST